ncbi:MULTISPECIES: hypothetical protein [unclassified Endozoicomonas]|nr:MULTISPECIES: hypothetical protein [unclassified Endozoicomonas]
MQTIWRVVMQKYKPTMNKGKWPNNIPLMADVRSSGNPVLDGHASNTSGY